MAEPFSVQAVGH